ncbi:DUF871 domain-containing protein [Streptococcus ovuberis]|uniref:DUF871 domain-containing protein n=1 Tax=Streptococcus ovuberis TaxID=1936207 RepID=A0A7X6MZW3_9STRE|nr:MupG family TIM beta-alpha barrel fold protein [Streptococcus ovuberis]NKZ20759.1 DUF871 domain-containing protein [Streptococcus ovuberis]
MVKLGFSLYPEGQDLERMFAYIDGFKGYDCERVFLSLLQLGVDDKETFDHYRRIVAYCQQAGFRVFADLNPDFIKKMGWEDDLIGRAAAFGLSGIRLDESYDDDQLVELTKNALGIQIELNMSTEPDLLDRLRTKGANFSQITACHNFYPRRFTGLGTTYFQNISQAYSNYGIERAAFISAKTATTGPWPVFEGLPTLEMHRDLPIHAQYKWLAATGLVDHIIISNQFISAEELASIVQNDTMTFDVQLSEGLSEVEVAIVTEPHAYRGDVSDYVVRSTGHRARYSQARILPRQAGQAVKRGTILIDNQDYARYCGELQLALMEFTASHKTNLVGQICDYDLPLLDLLLPWQAFSLNPVIQGDSHADE